MGFESSSPWGEAYICECPPNCWWLFPEWDLLYNVQRLLILMWFFFLVSPVCTSCWATFGVLAEGIFLHVAVGSMCIWREVSSGSSSSASWTNIPTYIICFLVCLLLNHRKFPFFSSSKNLESDIPPVMNILSVYSLVSKYHFPLRQTKLWRNGWLRSGKAQDEPETLCLYQFCCKLVWK